MSQPADPPTPASPAVSPRHFLIECLEHGEECFSSGYFNSREQALADLWLVEQSVCPECGGSLTITNHD